MRRRVVHKRERTARMLAGDLPCPDLEVPPDLFDRVQALVSQYSTQSTVLRLAVAEGLKVLERRVRS